MMLQCPWCLQDFNCPNPYKYLGDTVCPVCFIGIYIEVDEGGEGGEGGEGPIIAVYKEMPGCELFPPKEEV